MKVKSQEGNSSEVWNLVTSCENQQLFCSGLFYRERSLTIGGGGGGSVLFQRLEPKKFGPSQINSPKILAPFKMWAQKIVTLPCEKILIFLRTLVRDNYFTGIRKKWYYLFGTGWLFWWKQEKAFKKGFHEEARRKYENEMAVKKLESNKLNWNL